eukprot:106017_1
MSMGKSWNKLGRKGHRHERSQPQARQHLGFLEHHSDYTARAKNYHKKQDELQHLQLLASMKNPDEFHSDMVHTKALDGRLWMDKESKMSKKRLKIYRDNDNKYITMQLQHQQNKLKRDLNSFHCIDAANVSKNKNNNEMQIVESSNSKDALESNALLTVQTKGLKAVDHVIFVKDNKARREFNASSYFKTPRELLHQKHNRLRTSQLAAKQIKIDPKLATKLKKQTLLKYWQIQGRINKVQNIKKYQTHLNLKRKIHAGERYLVYKKRNADSGKVVKRRYKWPKQRKR